MSAGGSLFRCCPAIWAGPMHWRGRLAAVCGAVPVITTATDLHGLFAVDEWAKRQGCIVAEPERIKRVSGALLAGKRVHFTTDWPYRVRCPLVCSLQLTLR